MPRLPEAPSAGGSVLLAIGPLLQREVDLDELLDRIVHRIAQLVDADRGTIYLVDPARGELYSRAAHLPELPQIRLKIGQGVAGAVAATGQLLNLPAADADRRFFRDIDRKTGYRTRSILAAPLRDRRGEVIGVVQVLNAARGSFSGADEDLLRRLAAEAALAIESTSLYAQIKPGAPGAGGPTGAGRSLGGASARSSSRKERKAPQPERATGSRYNHVVGESAAMQRVYELTRKSAATSATVLLRGESGTGKELHARAIHYNSTRRDGPLVKLDCTTIPATLMENELFGHERGAYTGAERRAVGKCELADGGTLFIDEIGELPIALQAKLLRFLQDREFERVGGTRPLTSDARVVAATHRDLEAMVGRGEFREDLYYRVKVVQIHLPPLRERGEDVARLAGHFLDLYARKHGKPGIALSRPALARLIEHRWPGNIRELENCVESAVVLCEGGEIGADHLALPPASMPSPPASPSGFRARPLAEIEREHILRTLEALGGNRTQAAETLQIGRNTLHRKLREYGIA